MYTLREPAAPLRSFVEHYWFVHATESAPVDLSVDVYVDGRADLIFTFGAPYTRRVLGEAPHRVGTSNLDAQRLRPIRIEQRGAVVVSGVRFRTAGLAPFVSMAVDACTDRVVPLAEVFGPEALAVEKRMGAAIEDVAEQTRVLDDFLGRRLDVGPGVRRVQALKTRLEDAGGLLRMDELAAEAGLSGRQMDRLFRTHLGFGPKTFARNVRFQRGLALLRTDPGCTLADVGVACGYYDQSHFVREFRRFAGVPPRARVGYFPADGPADFSPNVVRFVQDPRLRAGEAGGPPHNRRIPGCLNSAAPTPP
jgi:AraC-like DNA-binding protein